MTEEYKEQLLNYVTGNLENTTPTTDEIIKETIELNRQDWINFIPNGWGNFKFEGLISPNENTSNLFILYGGYYKNNEKNNCKGIIILLDSNFKPIKTFYKFDSGTDLRYIQNLKQEEDGSFYMIDDTYWSSDYTNNDFKNGIRRFVLLNNFSIQIDDEYKLKLRTSYIFGTNYNNFYCKDMFKNPNSPHYVFLGKYYETYQNTKTISLKINVGSTNEWNYINTTEYEYAGGFVEYDEDDNYYVKAIFNELSALRNYFITGIKNFSSNSYTMTNTGNFNYYFDIDTQNYDNQVVFINKNEVYFVGNNQIRQIGPYAYNKYIGLYYYNYTTSNLKTIYEEFIENAKSISKRALYINQNFNEIYIQYNNNFVNNTADYYYQRLKNDEWNPISLGNHNFIRNQRNIAVKNKFNLTTIYLYANNPRSATWYNLLLKEIYNPNQYNGEPYIDTNVLNPLYSNLYSNGSLVFSRNLYNISKQNNMSMSSVEIPNSYLNDLTITQNDLISETNFQMISNQINWTKNIYEVVDLNFLNTITVIDEDTNTPYLNSAIRVNNSITDINDYSASQCTKYRINYGDGTSQINSLNWYEINRYNKETKISFYANKDILSIDLISYDTNTIYLTIPVSVEIGKYYTITQKIRTGKKLIPVELTYNNEQINYNNEPIMVYIETEEE